MTDERRRLLQLALGMLSFGVLFASLYFQVIMHLQPCPLCLMQRYCVGMLFLLCIIGTLLPKVSQTKTLVILQCLVALAGLYFASRQLWLQSLPPDQLPACLPGLEVLIRYFPWTDVLHALIWGAADCGEIKWQWLGLSMPAWAGIYFLGMFLVIGGIASIGRK